MFRDLRIWLNHFEYHAEHPRRVPGGLPDVLMPGERRLIADSIATFQLGEASAGGTLLAAVRRFAGAHQIPELVKLMELFVREEQRHAELLREFMQSHDIPQKSRDWTDRVFRVLRRLAGFELYLHVLISAELIGNVYYRALEAATECRRLKVLCRTLVCDELAHVGFESQLMRALAGRRPAVLRLSMGLAHRAFFMATAGVVWLTHRRVLSGAGHDVRTFLRACRAQYAFYLDAPQPALETLAGPQSEGLTPAPSAYRAPPPAARARMGSTP